MIPNWMVVLILGLIIFSWFLVGEKKSFSEKIGTILFFLAMYLAYHALNTEGTSEYFQKLKEMIGR